MPTKIQLRRGTAAQWTAANPVLADGEPGIETDTGLYKVGNGVDNWVTRPYSTLRNIDTLTVANMSDQATPSTPASGTMNLYAKSLGGRMLLRTQGPSGIATPLQPSFFQNNIVMINTGATTAVQTIGNTVASVGTISHPAVTEQYGYMANFVSAATALATAGTGNTTTLWQRGSVPGGSSGFFFNARIGLPDANYESTGVGTGTRIVVGLTNSAFASALTSDNIANHSAAFIRRHADTGTQDTNWQFVTRNTSQTVVDTGMVFAAQKVYDFYIFCPPLGNTIYWRVDNVTDNTTAEGSTTATLPGSTSLMRAGFQLMTVDAVARNIRMQRIYTESDR